MPELGRELLLSSANSINVGRLLPQMAYYASASLELWRRDGRAPNFIIPTGNLGNVAACLWAREVGLPIGDIVLATNANRDGPRFPANRRLAAAPERRDAGVRHGRRQSRATWSACAGSFPTAPRSCGARSPRCAVSDDEIRATIRRDFAELGPGLVPAHRDRGARAYRQLPAARRAERWVLVATAHPAKFNDIVEPLDRPEVPVSPALRDACCAAVDPDDGRAASRRPAQVLHGAPLNIVSRTCRSGSGSCSASPSLGAGAYFIRDDSCGCMRARRAIDNVISLGRLRRVAQRAAADRHAASRSTSTTCCSRRSGLLLIDLFDVHGMVFAGEKMEQWSIFGPKRHFTVTNPLPMLYDRVAAVRHVAGDDVAVDGRIVFSMRGEFPKGRPEMVIRLDELQDEFPIVERSRRAARPRRSPKSGNASSRPPSPTRLPADGTGLRTRGQELPLDCAQQ